MCWLTSHRQYCPGPDSIEDCSRWSVKQHATLQLYKPKTAKKLGNASPYPKQFNGFKYEIKFFDSVAHIFKRDLCWLMCFIYSRCTTHNANGRDSYFSV